MCVMRRMISKMFKDLKNAMGEILVVIITLLIIVLPIVVLNLLSQYLFGDPWLLSAVLILVFGLLGLGTMIVASLVKRYKNAKEYCRERSSS